MRYQCDADILWNSHHRTVRAGEILELTPDEAKESRHFKPIEESKLPESINSPTVPTKEVLVEEARALGIPGAKAMKKDDLIAAIAAKKAEAEDEDDDSRAERTEE